MTELKKSKDFPGCLETSGENLYCIMLYAMPLFRQAVIGRNLEEHEDNSENG